jgi:hypothetical protein
MTATETDALTDSVKNWALLVKNNADGWIVLADHGKAELLERGEWN